MSPKYRIQVSIIKNPVPEHKDLFNRSHNPSNSTLYPDVLKIKTIIVVKQIFGKIPFVYILFTNP